MSESVIEEILVEIIDALEKQVVDRIAEEYGIGKKLRRAGVVKFIIDHLDRVHLEMLSQEEIVNQVRFFLERFQNSNIALPITQDIISNATSKIKDQPRRSNRMSQVLIKNVYEPTHQTAACHCDPILQANSPTLQCSSCLMPWHPQCLWGMNPNQQYNNCPLCFLKRCLPNQPTIRVLFAGYMKWHDCSRIKNRIEVSLSQIPKDYEVELRCVRLSQDHMYTLKWPEYYTVELNGKFLKDERPLAQNSPQKYRNEGEIKLDRLHFMKKQGMSSIVIHEKQILDSTINVASHKPSDKTSHMIAVVLVKTNHLEDIWNMEKLSVQQCKQKLKENMKHGQGGECSVEGLRVSLKCHFSGQKIQIPVRSKFCNSHYQPFDLNSFLLSNWTCKQHWQRWRCPICKKPAYSLQIDLYLFSLIQAHPHATQLSFDRYGQLKSIESYEQTLKTSNKRMNNSNVESIDADNFVEFIDLSTPIKKNNLCQSVVQTEQTFQKYIYYGMSQNSSEEIRNINDSQSICSLDLKQLNPSVEKDIVISQSKGEHSRAYPARKREIGQIQQEDYEQISDKLKKKVKSSNTKPCDNPLNFMNRRGTGEEENLRVNENLSSLNSQYVQYQRKDKIKNNEAASIGTKIEVHSSQQRSRSNCKLTGARVKTGNNALKISQKQEDNEIKEQIGLCKSKTQKLLTKGVPKFVQIEKVEIKKRKRAHRQDDP